MTTGKVLKLGVYLDKALSAVLAFCTYLGVVCLVIVLIVVMIDVVIRPFGLVGVSSIEISGYALVSLVLLPAAYVIRRGLFIRIGMVADRLSPSIQTILRLVTDVITLFTAVILLWSCWDLTRTLYIHKTYANTTLAPPLYMPQLATTVGMALVVIVLVVMILQSILSRGDRGK